MFNIIVNSGWIAMVLLLYATSAVAAEVHRWVDENGVVHYAPAYKIPEQYRDSATHIKVPKSAYSEVDRTSVALQMRGNVAVVQATLNGGTYASFVVDTGSSSTMISHATARALGLEIEGKDLPMAAFRTANGVVSAPMIMLESVDVGGMQVRDVMASIHDISPEVSGLLGMNFLSHFRMDIDSNSGLLHLERK